ncbi:MAG: hypothetical protein ISP91_08975 [Pseudomonadales bacterium]|nr:hypothetical protein [Pseudomonadales bacterium]
MQQVRDFGVPGNETLVNEMFSWLEFPRLILSTPLLFDVPCKHPLFSLTSS